ncbi:MAG: ribonuclease D, partial [Actinomycetota bacterium]|nr:ribonuclease D [Actinomycetota bacterium]
MDSETIDESPPLEPLTLRDGLSPVINTPNALQAYARAIEQGSGPVALDAERASGYRYSMRAYLIQVRRAGAGTALIDPIAVP